MAHLKNINKTADGETARVRIAQFEAKVYFKEGDDESLTQLATSVLQDEFQMLPPERTSAPHALERALLSKMPSSISAQRDRSEDQLVDAEVLGRDPPWTYMRS